MKYYARDSVTTSGVRVADNVGTPVLCGDTVVSTKAQMKFVVYYPLAESVTFERKRTKWTFQNIIDEVRKIYQTNIYKNETQQKKYGVWGHGIKDLVIEALDIQSKKKVPTITVQMGS